MAALPEIILESSGATVAEAIEQAAGAGYPAVAIGLIAGQSSPASLSLAADQTACVDFSKQAAARGIQLGVLILEPDSAFDLTKCQSVHPAAGQSATDSIAVTNIIAALDRAAWIGAGQVVLPPMARSGEQDLVAGDYDGAARALLDALSRLRFEAQRRAVEIVCPLSPFGIGRSPSEARTFFDLVNSPWVGASVEWCGLVHADRSPDRPSNASAAAAVEMLGILLHRVRLLHWSAEPDNLDGAAVAQVIRRTRFDGTIAYRPSAKPAIYGDWSTIKAHLI